MGIGRDCLGYALCDQPQRRAVLVLFQERNSLTPETAHFAIWEDGLESITDLSPVAPILHRKQYQYSAITGLRPYSPLLVEIRGETFNILAIEGPDGHHGDLSICLVVHLGCQLLDCRSRLRINDAGKIIHVSGGLELLDRFGSQQNRQRNEPAEHEGPGSAGWGEHQFRIINGWNNELGPKGGWDLSH